MSASSSRLARGLLCALIAIAFAVARNAHAAPAGTFSVLTYNVAGLPLGLSDSTPEVNSALISPLLNSLDFVAVQEDFAFHDDLISAVTLPHLTLKDTTDSPDAIALGLNLGLGDGLNRMSNSAFSDFERVTWETCFGILTNASDCLAPKGFSVGRHEFAPGLFVDVYNLHSDAGSADEDKAVRRDQLRQLVAFIEIFSANRAVLVLGDTNSRYTRDGDIVPEFLADTGLRDVWVDLVLGGIAPTVGPRLDACVENGMAGGDCEQLDKIFFRSGGGVALTPIDYDVPSSLFSDAAGVPLSDHEPVTALFAIAALPEPTATALVALALAALVSRRR